MSEQDDIYRIAGEALELSQMLEQALTIPILMLFMIESGWQKDIASKEIETLIREAKATSTAIKSQPVNERFRQNIRAQVGQVTLLVQNGSMGELKRALESRLHVTPGGPSAFLHVLQEALDARNYLCHAFFKDAVESSTRENGNFDAIAKLREIETSLRKAISFANGLADTLRRQFPQTFESDSRTVKPSTNDKSSHGDHILKASLSELVEALNRTTKMKRAPAGSRSTGLKEGAFVPELTGIRVEMPGGSSLVNINSGKLETEVVFEAKRMAPIAKVLSSYLHKEDNVTILVSNTELTFQCGSSRLKLPRTR